MGISGINSIAICVAQFLLRESKHQFLTGILQLAGMFDVGNPGDANGGHSFWERLFFSGSQVK